LRGRPAGAAEVARPGDLRAHPRPDHLGPAQPQYARASTQTCLDVPTPVLSDSPWLGPE
jgi:hypothetical protein